MSDTILQALCGWNRAESRRWHAWFTSHPTALDLPLGAGSTSTVRRLVLHTAAVDLRYAQRLLGLPVSAFETFEASQLDELFALAERALVLLGGWLEHATPAELLERVHTFSTLSAGERSASARKIVLHACTHHARHWAQIASVLRMHGQPSDWPHDFLLSDAMR